MFQLLYYYCRSTIQRNKNHSDCSQHSSFFLGRGTYGRIIVPTASSFQLLRASLCYSRVHMETRPSLHGISDFMHNFSLQVAGEWPWHPCREPWICLPTKGLCNMQHMEIGKTTLIGKGTIPFGNIVVPLNSILFILSSLLSHGRCQKPGPPSKAGSFPKICLA